MENINQIFVDVDKDGWTNDIQLTQKDESVILCVVGEEYEWSKEQVDEIRRFFNSLPL